MSRVHTRSEITVEDQKSKKGSLLDGEQIKGERRTLLGNKHEIRLGTLEDVFKIFWFPIVLSFSLPSKAQKSADPLISIRERLEAFDIKTIIPYIIDKTTHVVATKRNTAKGLQALINGKYIVNDQFVDALVLAATQPQTDDPSIVSPLETDFDANWPNELDYLPPPGKEPSQRPDSFFAPNPGRIRIFEGYYFVFCEQTQFDTLLAPITNGGGKALYFPLDPGKTTAGDIVKYVKNVAGEKGDGELEDASGGKGVVVVRFKGKGETENWCIELGQTVALQLDQRLIEQNEFLDAILRNDASGLRKRLPEEDAEMADPPPEEQPPQPAPVPAVQTQSTGTGTRAKSRRIITSRFTGFNDGFDPSSFCQVPKPLSQASQMDNMSQDASLGDSLFIGSASTPPSTQPQGLTSRKRRSPPSPPAQDEDAIMDEILPAAAGLKRRKIAEDRANAARGITPAQLAPPPPPKLAPRTVAKKVAPKKKLDVQEALREQRDAAATAQREEDDSLRDFASIEISAMKSLVAVAELVVRPRVDAERNHAWSEAWNGRKNFKKFRRQGDAPARRGPAVIVPLVPAGKRDFGIGEGYWEQEEERERQVVRRVSVPVPVPERKGTGKGKGRVTQQANDDFLDDSDDEEFRPFSTARSRAEPSATPSLPPPKRQTRLTDNPPATTAATSTVRSSASRKSTRGQTRTPVPQPHIQAEPIDIDVDLVAEMQTQTQTETETQAQPSARIARSSQRTLGKRTTPAPSDPGVDARPAKKPRSAVVKPRGKTPAAGGLKGREAAGSGESGDELRFRFRRRK
ncbi:MAG: hypothetical protein M1829_001241 [Trizodia sp. TS-e1964]|nr:MAG: hypothetical protein M1829_001241 [Trizodia sp. TS-e1964]